MGSNHAPEDVGNISEMFSELETEVGLKLEMMAPHQARLSGVESSKSEEKPQVRLALPI